MWRSKLLVFSVCIEINSVFVPGHRNRLDTRVGIKIDLIPAKGSKLTWSCAGSKLTWFQCEHRLYLITVCGVELDLISLPG